MKLMSHDVSRLKRVTVITHYANDRTNHQSFLEFRKIPWKYQNSAAKGKFCGLARNSTARGKLWALMICSETIMKLVPSDLTELQIV